MKKVSIIIWTFNAGMSLALFIVSCKNNEPNFGWFNAFLAQTVIAISEAIR